MASSWHYQRYNVNKKKHNGAFSELTKLDKIWPQHDQHKSQIFSSLLWECVIVFKPSTHNELFIKYGQGHVWLG